MTKTSQIKERALALTRAQSTDSLVEAFGHTETLIEQGLNEDDFAAVTTSRGWIIQVLEERGDLDRILPL